MSRHVLLNAFGEAQVIVTGYTTPYSTPANPHTWGKENKRESDVNKTMFGIMSSIWLPQTSRTYSGYTHNIRLCTV